MSLENIMDESPNNLTQSLILPGPEFKELGEAISEDLNCLKECMLSLEDYQGILGTEKDTILKREKMKEDIACGNKIIMKTMENFQLFDIMNLKEKADQDLRNKLSRNAQQTFQLYRERYTNALREIQKIKKSKKKMKDVESKHVILDIEEEKYTSDTYNSQDQEEFKSTEDQEDSRRIPSKKKGGSFFKNFFSGSSGKEQEKIVAWEDITKEQEDFTLSEDTVREIWKSKGDGDLKKFTHKKKYAIGLGLILSLVAVALILSSSFQMLKD
jgi:hypothetical protein